MNHKNNKINEINEINEIKERIYGGLYGQIIGDAFGARYEFMDKLKVKKQLKSDTKNNFIDILGEGHFNVQPGQVTDDTELAFAIITSIIDKNCIDIKDIAKRFIYWYNSKPIDIGNTTRLAFENAKNYHDIYKNALEYNMDSLSNGCLMKISPIGIYGICLSDDKMLNYVTEIIKLTNPNKICIEAGHIYCLAIKYSILYRDLKKIYSVLSNYIKNNNPHSIFKKILENVINKNNNYIDMNMNIIVADGRYQGLLTVALHVALFELFWGNDFYETMINIIKIGGDTDTNGCIGGAIVGSYRGYKNIPVRWMNVVNKSSKVNDRVKKYEYTYDVNGTLNDFVALVINRCIDNNIFD